MHIVLYQPEIPSNTGNIGRSCAATGAALDLIEPLGFLLNDKTVRRAGMDYWEALELHRHVNYERFMQSMEAHRAEHSDAKLWFATTKAKRMYTEASFGAKDFIMFGRESAGIPEEILAENEPQCIRIPMGSGVRSLNLANSVAIVLYEALRQNDFAGLVREGELHRLHWRA
ncbi:tRNA (cytidine(34)-2'-O)-methyltransferase [Lachnoclostridium sp. Marseille-P6806]|uniref:tRNA (cytidine(34)-2'-O)-methyltransferase n=1 Tax=Lachnoclostridium sp. Marseille-P6806 TaxID=2364793 RepID=UPI001030F959|nr:tRNA (cytidine(34)-2'-O)-methyltransferase [Lachnoclostridium sp. Marseille-P6806]